MRLTILLLCPILLVGFSSWSPAAGSISKSEIQEMGKNLKFCFKGIPYHLRSRSTVDSLAKACGDSWIVEEESINHTGDNARVIMKVVNLEKILRVLYLTESGQRFSVVVGVITTDDCLTGLEAGVSHVSAIAPQISMGESNAGISQALGSVGPPISSGPLGFEKGMLPNKFQILQEDGLDGAEPLMRPIEAIPLEVGARALPLVDLTRDEEPIVPVSSINRGREIKGQARPKGRGRGPGQIIWAHRHPWMNHRGKSQTRSGPRRRDNEGTHEQFNETSLAPQDAPVGGPTPDTTITPSHSDARSPPNVGNRDFMQGECSRVADQGDGNLRHLLASNIVNGSSEVDLRNLID
ncbi:hypothetical protein FRX31_007076, partial [Thalictrum thalictroides]